MFLQKNRKSTNYNLAISNQTGKVKFLALEGYLEMLSGIVEDYDTRHLERIDRKVKEHGVSKQLLEVDCARFSDLIKVTDIDYLSIDVEGSEIVVLQSIDFTKHNITCICIENNYRDNTIGKFLAEKNYMWIKKTCTCDFYLLRNSNVHLSLVEKIKIYFNKARLSYRRRKKK